MRVKCELSRFHGNYFSRSGSRQTLSVPLQRVMVVLSIVSLALFFAEVERSH